MSRKSNIDGENGITDEQEIHNELFLLPDASVKTTSCECIVYWPTFRDKMIQEATTKDEMDKAHKCFMKENWLTEGLRKEIMLLAPKSKHIDKSDGKRNKKAFEEACSSMFPIGRKFASSIQIQQAARYFLNQWAISSTSFGKQI